MKKSALRSLGIIVCAILMCSVLLSGCGGQKLSNDFNEDDVKQAAENVITLVNSQDTKALKELCTVKMKEALTDDVMKQIYDAIGEGGTFVEIKEVSVAGAKDKASEEEFAVVVASAKYEIKTFVFTITFTKQMKLAGLYYK
ncbi:MAG: DUF3887 domain-containing protein [Coriobacteriaceae bacterium]|nr:DUF3887 domain-containing protein [Coriobacteriaceae bacterium]